MAKKNDDLAAALNALADGHHADEEHVEDHGDHHDAAPPAAAPAPAQPARPVKVARPAAAPPPKATRPEAPAAAPAPVAKAAPPAPVAAEAKPASRVRPSAPSSRPAAPSAPVPPPPSAPADAAGDDPFNHAPPDDDDAVIVPAPDQSVFAPRPKAAPVVRKARVPVYQTLHFRQTVIPVMLTSGVLAIVLAGIRFTLSDDSIFSAVPTSVALVLIVLGLLLLGAAALNIMQVKQMLTKDAAAARQ